MGLTRPRAAQIFDIDYKQATRVITVANITLDGGAPAVVDGVSLVLSDRILVTGQTTASQNGLYDVTVVGVGSDGTWERTSDGNATGEILAGMVVMVTEGVTYHDTQWKLTTDNPIVIGTTALIFELNTSGNSISNGTSNITVLSNANVNIAVANVQIAAFASSGAYVTGLISATGNVTSGNAGIVGTTASTSRTTGALTVGGGIGVAGDLYAGNSIVVDGGAYGTVTTTQFAGVFAKAIGPNATSLMQVKGNDNTAGIGMRALTGATSLIYSNASIDLRVGSTIRDLDTPSGGTTIASVQSTGLVVTGLISATGNITGSYILGNGSLLTGLPETYANSNVASYLSSGTVGTDIKTTTAISATGAVTGGSLVGNVTTAAQPGITSVGTLTSLSVTGNTTSGNISTTGSVGSHLVPSIDLAYSLGNATHRWANLYLSGNTIYLGNSIITESANGDVVIENSGSFAVPVGTTAQRSAIQGAIRYNTTIGGFETFDGAGWNKLAYGTATDFPFGDYGSLSDTQTTDAFGVSLVITFDCNDPGPLQFTDLGDSEAYVGA